MTATLSPSSLTELADAVRSVPRLLPVGAQTKPRLSHFDGAKLSTANLSGIVEYESSEFTFTALAGTPLRDIISALSEKGQYLPFDPLLVDAGATWGGTVASGLNGPGRFRFGGIRDFILGVKFVDGSGRLLRMGGKVVKNAAGFDVPKFLVGSLGRFGVMGEITAKVFPRAPSSLTIKIPVKDIEAAARLLVEAGNTRWEPDALEIAPASSAAYLRIAGPAEAIDQISREILARWSGEILSYEFEDMLWSGIREFRWAYSEGTLVKVIVTPAVLVALDRLVSSIDGVRMHIGGGGNVVFISLPSTDMSALDRMLRELGLSALVLRGSSSLWLGVHSESKIVETVKKAFDPDQRFPSLND